MSYLETPEQAEFIDEQLRLSHAHAVAINLYTWLQLRHTAWAADANLGDPFDCDLDTQIQRIMNDAAARMNDLAKAREAMATKKKERGL